MQVSPGVKLWVGGRAGRKGEGHTSGSLSGVQSRLPGGNPSALAMPPRLRGSRVASRCSASTLGTSCKAVRITAEMRMSAGSSKTVPGRSSCGLWGGGKASRYCWALTTDAAAPARAATRNTVLATEPWRNRAGGRWAGGACGAALLAASSRGAGMGWAVAAALSPAAGKVRAMSIWKEAATQTRAASCHQPARGSAAGVRGRGWRCEGAPPPSLTGACCYEDAHGQRGQRHQALRHASLVAGAKGVERVACERWPAGRHCRRHKS
jgi:hypothetical protein